MTELTDIAKTTLEARYLLRGDQGEIIETPDGLWHRIANAVAEAEVTDSKKKYWADRFYKRLRFLEFLANSPTIMNAGLENGQYSACFVLEVEDSIDGIFNTLRDAAKVHQSGGGTGFSGGRLRPKDAPVDNKQGVASGPISFFTVYDQATEIMKQGGRRKGANMLIMPVNHPDILEFIDKKLEKKQLENFNVSVAISDDFMRALERGTTYKLYHPAVGITGELDARFVWEKIAKNAHKSAEPGLVFIDRINAKSPYWEEIEATNPCGEQPLPPNGACNLGSIDVSKFVVNSEVDWVSLQHCVIDCVRFLDNVISVNTWPTEAIKEHAERYRNIGLGVMGFADYLIKLGIPYNSTDGLLAAYELQQFVNSTSHAYSAVLAVEKGLPSAAPFKTFFDYSSPNRRNATLTTIAPTGTISMIAGCSASSEPNFAFVMERHQMDRKLIDEHRLYKQAKQEGWFDEKVFVDAHDVEVDSHVDMQAAFQKHCDSGVSKTINLPEEATVEDVMNAYIRAWKQGCKGITVYRDGSREGVLHKKDEPKSTADEYCPECGAEMNPQSGCMTCPQCAYSVCLIA